MTTKSMRLGIIFMVGALPACAPQHQSEQPLPSSSTEAVTTAVQPASEAQQRADALIADLRQKEEAYKKLDAAASAKPTSSAEIPVVVEYPRNASADGGDDDRSSSVSSALPASESGETKRRDPHPFDILSSSYAVTEKNRVWWRFSWQMSIRNQSRDPILISPGIQFQDDRGFQLDTGISRQRVIAGSSVIDVSDSTLIDVSNAASVAKAIATVRLLAQ